MWSYLRHLVMTRAAWFWRFWRWDMSSLGITNIRLLQESSLDFIVAFTNFSTASRSRYYRILPMVYRLKLIDLHKISWPSGVVWMVNRMGPRTDPCGTPHFNSCSSDVDFLIWTVWVRPVRYGWNQSKTFPLIPNDDSSVWSKRWWSIVSNAALRSRRTSIAPSWVSTARRRSFWTRNRPVSVLSSWRYADWKTSYRWWAFRRSTNYSHTMRSTSLGKREMFETGRKFFKISQSSMAFFRSGKAKVLFNSALRSMFCHTTRVKAFVLTPHMI